MAQNKEGSDKKPGVKIQDLSPRKDAKGGVAKNQNTVDMNKGFSDQNKGPGADQNRGPSADQNSFGGGNQN